jgi:hypothetical protein
LNVWTISGLPVGRPFTCQSRIVLSQLAVRSCVPSGLKTTSLTWLVCPVKIASSLIRLRESCCIFCFSHALWPRSSGSIFAEASAR